MSSPIPVTILSGFLGAGKTTLLRHLLKAEHGLKIAVIENEFSDAGIDTQLLGDEPVQVMTLSNGCVCCTIHTDLTKALYLLLERLDNYLQNFRGWQWVYASMSIVTLAAVGVIIASGNMDEPSESYVSSTKDKEEILLTEKAVPVSKETIERTSTEVAPTEKPEFTTGDSSYETSAKDNQLKPDSHADKKPVSRVLIEM